MALSLFDPFADLTRLRRQIDRAFEEGTGAAKAQPSARAWRPPADLYEDEDALRLKLDLPGMDREALEVQIAGEELIIRGERKWTAPEGEGCVHSERPYGQFSRAFRLGIPVRNDAVEARYEDGVLTVVLPKAETFKPRKVAVRIGSDDDDGEKRGK